MLNGIGRAPETAACALRVLQVLEATITGTKRHLLDLLRSPRGRAGRETVLHPCTTQRQVKETTRVYRELLAAPALAAVARSGGTYARL